MRSWQVAIRPAKPLAFGTVNGKPVFGLPGNPVSSMVSYELFARPALRQMSGHRRVFRPEVTATAGEAVRRRADGKLHLARVRVGPDGGGWVADLTGGRGAHHVAAVAHGK